jgi:tetratricopeptide (TPR) repeat protein
MALRSPGGPTYLLIALLSFCAPLGLVAQTRGDLAYDAKRQKASELFEHGKRLEALPLLEELVKTEPKDGSMLVALAACLVEHAATLPDQEGGGKERLRARGLLDTAWELGNRSTLAMNLSELLNKLPESGAIKFSDDPQVDRALRTGEAAFSRRDFDEARKNYSKALELEPGNYSAALFIGNAYDKQNEFARAAEWYERAIQLDPNVETAYRYYADMLAREGGMATARTMLIHAAVAEPYNRIVWRELRAWATLNHTKIAEVFVGVPVERKDKPTSEVPDGSTIWQSYREARTHWQTGDGFKKRFPEEKQYRHSLPEEFEALTTAAKNLEQLKSDAKFAELIRSDESLGLLLKLHRARLIEPYVLFSLGDAGIARDYSSFRSNNRDKLEEYLDKFVVPPSGSTDPPRPR